MTLHHPASWINSRASWTQPYACSLHLLLPPVATSLLSFRSLTGFLSHKGFNIMSYFSITWSPPVSLTCSITRLLPGASVPPTRPDLLSVPRRTKQRTWCDGAFSIDTRSPWNSPEIYPGLHWAVHFSLLSTLEWLLMCDECCVSDDVFLLYRIFVCKASLSPPKNALRTEFLSCDNIISNSLSVKEHLRNI